MSESIAGPETAELIAEEQAILVEEKQRDEVAEVRKLSRNETKKVQRWRLLMTICLAVMGISVTTTIRSFLKREQDIKFRQAVRRKPAKAPTIVSLMFAIISLTSFLERWKTQQSNS